MTKLPDYENPPVDETYLVFQFAPVGFDIPHFGIYWERRRAEYPHYEVHPPTTGVMEQLDGPRRPVRVGIQLTNLSEVRLWMLDASKNRLFQVQRDRFVHNWRRVKGDEKYPRYPTQRESMRVEWQYFCDFLREEHIEVPKVVQCEVGYVNHIEYPDGNTTPNLERIVKAWRGDDIQKFLPSPEAVNFHLLYRFKDEPGRLHLSMEPVVRARDGKEVLQLSLLARGAPKSSSLDDLLNWLDMGREWIVKGFADFTTDAIQQTWGRK